MLFDEGKRKKLLDIYRGLSEDERAAYRVLSVIYTPMPVTNIANVMRAVGSRYPWGKWALKRWGELLDEWLRKNIVERVIPNRHEAWRCHPLLVEIATRESLDRGEFDTINNAAKNILDLKDESERHFYVTGEQFLRMAREVFYRGDDRRYAKLMSLSVASDTERANVKYILQVLANPLDMKYLSNLPPTMATNLFDVLLLVFMSDAQAFKEVRNTFESKYKERPESFYLWAEYATLEGRFEEVADRSGRYTGDPELLSYIAASALFRGEPAQALSLYENGLKSLRRERHKRKTAFYSWTGVFYPILLMSSGADSKKMEEYLEGANGLHSDIVQRALSLLYIFYAHVPSERYFIKEAEFLAPNSNPVDAFFFILYGYWLGGGSLALLEPLSLKIYERLSSLGFTFLAANLEDIRNSVWPKTAKQDSVPLQYPIKDLVRRQSDWERVLSALSEIGRTAAKTNAPRDKRFIWEIEWSAVKKTARVSRISIRPMEQTANKSGWSKGKAVALSRIYKKADIESMTEQDRIAASSIHEEHGWGGAVYGIDYIRILSALAGHPYIFRAKDGAHVEIAIDEPRITTVERDGGYVVTMSPFPEGDVIPQYIASEDGPNCLRVTIFKAEHFKMASLIGEEGASVPADGKLSLLKTLGDLSPVVSIHSDIDGIETGADIEQVEAESRICVQIQPSDLGLDVEAVVRPLGLGSPPCRPGAGGVNVYGLIGETRTLAKRDLSVERVGLAKMINAVPALSEGEQISDDRWYLPTPELSLEFLTQIKAMGDEVVPEWPKGETMRVRKQVSLSSLGVSLRSADEWFSLSGEVKIDEGLVMSLKDILGLMKAAHGRFLPLGDGQFLALTKEFKRRLEELSSFGDLRGDELRISPLAAHLLEPLEDEAASFVSDAEWKKRVNLISEAMKLNPELPSTFKGEMREYQLEGYRWMSRLSHWGAGACLADDMGLGKTIQALALLLSRAPLGDTPSLVVAPTSVCSNWISEAARFAPTLNMKELRYGDREKTLSELSQFDVVVTSYGLLQNEIERLSAIEWRTIVLDEAQAIKNMGTKRSAAAMKLKGNFRVATTGTPIENRMTELWNIFRFLNPHYLGSLDSFSRRFIIPIERDGDKRAKTRLKRILQPFILRRNKEQVLEELPAKTEITLRVEMKEKERAFYEALRREAVESLSIEEKDGETRAEDKRFQIFAELMRLRRACCSSALAMKKSESDADIESAMIKEFPSAKLEAFAEILSDLRSGSHKALVFSQFVGHLTILRNYLDGERIPYQYLDGSTSPREREKRVAAFQNGEGDCFLISLKAGGVGLNLTAADYVIHMDPWWNPAVEQQASDRAHRIGQDRPVTVYRIVAKDTIEEKIVDLHAWKRDLAESLIGDSDAPARISAAEMLELIKEAR
ncbi:SWF/SNF family helicase [Synergistales bacterium]|nr:SWF/SNF family helicase [Synergistales bacterium]